MSETRPVCAQVTTVHRALDVRIYRKIARTLAAHGFDVVLIHPEGETVAADDAVRLSPLGLRGGRLRRATIGGMLAFARAKRLGAKVFHFHDPELLPWAVLWRLSGGVAIYDVHEDVPKAVMRKAWIPAPFRAIVSGLMRAAEWIAARSCAAVVAATEPIASRFPADRTVIVRNYPENLRQFASAARPWDERKNAVMYAGTLSRDRGLQLMLDAIQLVDPTLGARLILAGPLRGASLADSLGRELPAHLLSFEGHVSRERVVEMSGEVRIGLHVVEPLEAYKESLPIKIFEYMAAGIPSIISDFPAWRTLVEENRCGVTVDPLSATDLAAAIERLLRDPATAAEMGRQGAKSAASRYDWKQEGATLVALYRRLLSNA